MGISDFFQVLARHRLAIVVAAILGLALGLGASVLTNSRTQEVQTSSTATVRALLLSDEGVRVLEQRLAALTDGVVLAAVSTGPSSRAKLYAEIMESPSVVSAAATSVGRDYDEVSASLTVAVEEKGNITISAASADTDLATRTIEALVQETNDRIARLFGARSSVQLVGSPIVTRNPAEALRTPDRDATSARIASELVAENPLQFSASAEALSGQLTAEDYAAIDATLSDGAMTNGIAERLTWGGAAAADAAAGATAGSEVTLTVVAPSSAGALEAASATLDAIDARLTPVGSDVSPLVRLEATASETQVDQPRQDRTLTNVILGLLIGLAAGIGFAFVRESRDPRIRTARQLAAYTSVPPIGLITYPVRAEDFQALRSSVMFGPTETSVIAVTSPSEGDGAWDVAQGLAAAITHTDRSVLVVDADMRAETRDRAHDPASPGLADVLEGRAGWETALEPTGDPGVTLLRAGEPQMASSDLLSRPRFLELLDELRARFDYVICVPPPLTDGSDAAIVAHCVGASLVVVRVDSTTSADLDEAANRLMQVDAKVLGVVVTGIPAGDTDHWGAKYFQAATSPA